MQKVIAELDMYYIHYTVRVESYRMHARGPSTDMYASVQWYIYVPGRLHVGPLYPLGHWQVSLATQTPLPHGGSHTTEEETREHINIRT